MVISSQNQSVARPTLGFRIRQDTLDHLEPMEQAWARRLISRGEWHLVPSEEVI